jgi:hypothetical protein
MPDGNIAGMAWRQPGSNPQDGLTLAADFPELRNF